MYDVHPFAELIPNMSPEEYAELVEDVGRHGIREPVVLCDGLILDGRHRYRAWCELTERGHEVTLVTRDFDESVEGSPLAYVYSLNLHRRHLEYGQRAALAAETLDKLQSCEIAGERAEYAAQMWHVGSRAVYEAAKVRERAPETFEVMKDGGLSLRDAQRTIGERKREAGKPDRVDVVYAALADCGCARANECALNVLKALAGKS